LNEALSQIIGDKMKDLLFLIGLIVVLVIALKIFLWAFKSVLIIGLIAAAIYAVYRFSWLGKPRKT